MIIPFWLSREYFKKAPVTMMFVVLNLFFYLIIPMKNGINLPRKIAAKISHHDFIVVQAFLYENYVKIEKPKEWHYWTERFYSRRNELKGNELIDFWYQTSFKDGNFMVRALELPPYSDSLLYSDWKKVFLEFINYQKNDFSGLFGISTYGNSWSYFITYQFIHSGFLHLFSNMIILILFGILIEIQMGSLSVLFLYLAGGVVGAAFYSLTTGNNMAPLIGASGSVSALISFYLFTEPRRNLRFFYFLFPSEGYFGDIYLQKWWIVPLLILSDVNAILTMPEWSLNVAHTAHLGAIILGFVYAGITKIMKWRAVMSETLTLSRK